MLCIKCAKEFSAVKRYVVCSDCRKFHVAAFKKQGVKELPCIKCGDSFRPVGVDVVVCPKCQTEHLGELQLTDATSNITLEEAKAYREALRKDLEAVDMLIAGKSLSEIAKARGVSKQQISSFFSRKIRYANAGRDSAEAKSLHIKYKPLWPENLYCAVFKVQEYVALPPDALASVEHVLSAIKHQEREVIKRRFNNNGASLEEIGKILGVTRERVRQVEISALRKLRNPLIASVLKYGLEGVAVLSELEQSRRNEQFNAMMGERKRELIERIEADVQPRIVAVLDAAIKRYSRKYGVVVDTKLTERIDDEIKKEVCILIENGAYDLISSDVTEITLEDMDLSVRSYNCLKRADKNVLADLVEMTEEDFYHIHNLGFRSRTEVFEKMRDFGVSPKCNYNASTDGPSNTVLSVDEHQAMCYIREHDGVLSCESAAVYFTSEVPPNTLNLLIKRGLVRYSADRQEYVVDNICY